ncbi:MAG: histidine triad nucleotide-binding protein [Candidatus Portnoybacteria bacterium CG10_big_fil_rev_8_21_14_0_10_38_18]|uniref:Histidine triad nucleotide-binding protein n=1 Tax=Candidatus Portnoybacteria bacterium CG10_big_fil_rev_8_21_14_0_10_38_18 TaxID=1974813 RepID=A0A2M8KCS8_9BACT|nr:MAG: histidine triad nucleotide-binding protein [Candidatus Portnoybacteria bacterium CG10_big_fil_rev_8_21_14_0_10_38_18]
MEDCIFCNIANGKIPKEFIYEDDRLMVFTDVKPLAPVHLLIVPKEHIASINDLTEKHKDLIGEMFLLAKKMAKEHGISEAYKLAFNTGRKGGQLIDHLHLHLMGGWH